MQYLYISETSSCGGSFMTTVQKPCSLTLLSKTSLKSALLWSFLYRYSAFSRHLFTWDPKPSEPYMTEDFIYRTLV